MKFLLLAIKPKGIFSSEAEKSAVMHPWVNVVMGSVSSTSDANVIVQRDANGDFAGRYISAEYFRMTNSAQDATFTDDCHIVYRINDSSNVFLRSAKFSKVASLLGGLGANQTLLDLTEQRRADTVYENTSDKPIYVSVIAKASLQGGTVAAQLFIDDALASEAYFGNMGETTLIATVCGIVPKGARYKVVLINIKGSTLLYKWTELR